VIEGDYAVCTIPLSVLKKIPADFAPAYQAAVASTSYSAGAKIGIQFKRRFWEEDDHIMGGISTTSQDIRMVVYPSYGYQGKSGGSLSATIPRAEAGGLAGPRRPGGPGWKPGGAHRPPARRGRTLTP